MSKEAHGNIASMMKVGLQHYIVQMDYSDSFVK